ncbi:hypothetical protein WSM22_18850 [Cytophagales bacterium WSM2-2]|nr:hypothetical protein WSM22_18850 [Cytophagales bacterium WSM2-2]
MNYLLKNISWASGDLITADIRVGYQGISEIGNLERQEKDTIIDCTGHYLYPGFINSHDHVEMNLYPLMGNPPYQNYTEWAKDIYRPMESPVREIERLEMKDRLTWGSFKNLISGATTVVHHNKWHQALGGRLFPVRIRATEWAHSLAFEPKIEKKFPSNPKSTFVIHAAEGVDSFAKAEIPKLKELGMLQENTVLVHAVGMNERNMKLMEQSRVSMVWCPSSNLFMFNQTAPVNELKNKIKVVLGTDSLMTGPATLLDEMRVARETGMASTREIYDMVTSVPAKIFHMATPEIKIGCTEFWIAPIKHSDYYENVFLQHTGDIMAVVVYGRIRYCNAEIGKRLGTLRHRISVSGQEKLVEEDIPKLWRKLENRLGHLPKNSLRQIIQA